MALRKNTIVQGGVEVTDAYLKAMPVNVVGKTSLWISVQVLKDEEQLTPVTTITLTGPYDINGANPIKQAYDYIKTLPEFEGSVDC